MQHPGPTLEDISQKRYRGIEGDIIDVDTQLPAKGKRKIYLF